MKKNFSPITLVIILTVVGVGGYALFKRSLPDKLVPKLKEQTVNIGLPQRNSLGFFKKVSATPLAVNGKPYFLYTGAMFCPSCAAERWSIVKALSQFGTWTGLEPDITGDEYAGFSRLPTYNFMNAAYKSSYLVFAHKELADKNGRPIPGQELTEFEQKWFNQYNPKGRTPFLFLNGQYVQLAAGFSPELLSEKTFEAVKRDVETNAKNELVEAIDFEADILTAYICKVTNSQLSDVCAKSDIVGLVSQVP